MKKISFIIFSLLLIAACSPAEKDTPSVTLMMWQGDPMINAYMSDYVVPQLKAQQGIDLNIVSGQGNEIVSVLMAEIEAGKPSSEIDMVWINGETFYQLRQIEALYGPFVETLPNSQYINWESPYIAYDFQQPVEGYECPWGNVQLALIYNSGKVENPPMDLAELETWAKANPGKFTIGTEFTGMTLLKSWLIYLAGGEGSLSGNFDEEKYQKYSAELWAYLNRIKPYFWNNGESFPPTVAQMHQLFANGELWFTMSNNDGEVDNKILQGIFPETSKAYVPGTGTIINSHYMGIVNHSAHKETAMAVCNFLLSPEAQWEKMKPSVWGDYTVLALTKLPAPWQQKFAEIPGRKQAPKRSDIQDKALMEPAPEYMIRLFEDFRKEVIEK
ncbi:MAG: ABC transporter substrate-binding protein [Bacteroidia bacterium]